MVRPGPSSAWPAPACPRPGPHKSRRVGAHGWRLAFRNLWHLLVGSDGEDRSEPATACVTRSRSRSVCPPRRLPVGVDGRGPMSCTAMFTTPARDGLADCAALLAVFFTTIS